MMAPAGIEFLSLVSKSDAHYTRPTNNFVCSVHHYFVSKALLYLSCNQCKAFSVGIVRSLGLTLSKSSKLFQARYDAC